MELKVCTECDEDKSVEEFGKYFDNRSKKYYYNSKCKICFSNYMKKYHKDNNEKILKYQKEYREKYKKESAVHGKRYREEHKEELRIYMKKYYEDNKEKLKKASNQYYKDNEEYIKKYRESIKEHTRNYMKGYHIRYYQDNKDYYRASNASRRAIKLNQTPPNADKKKIRYMYQTAHKLRELFDVEYHVDHIIPMSKGGLHHEDNLQILTAEENLKKSNKLSSKYKGLTLKECKKMMGDV